MYINKEIPINTYFIFFAHFMILILPNYLITRSLVTHFFLFANNVLITFLRTLGKHSSTKQDRIDDAGWKFLTPTPLTDKKDNRVTFTADKISFPPVALLDTLIKITDNFSK